MSSTVQVSETLDAIGRWYGLDLSGDELDAYARLMGNILPSFERLAELSAPSAPSDRDPGGRPKPGENPLGAWYWRCSIEGAASGPLAGRTVAIKDSVCVAGIPMMDGSSLLEGFVPDTDAAVVTRILAAGGTIVGKTVCEPLCISDGSHLADTGPVGNPHDPGRSAGGSSGGSAAVVAAGDCDVAIGADTAGSIRMPAALCGVFGLKPTFGLVPAAGVCPIERTLDHVGPMARTAHDLALLLDAIAASGGSDDGRSATERPFTAGVDDGVEGLRIGIVDEGFELGNADPAVSERVRDAAQSLAENGASVERVSIPWHRDGEHVWLGIALEGAVERMIRGNGCATNVDDTHDLALIDAFRRGRAERSHLLAAPVKMLMLVGEYARREYGGLSYARARNLVPQLRGAYDEALARFDVLVMPTTPTTAPPLPAPEAPIEEQVAAAFTLHGNTCIFNATGHPAITIPCGKLDGLPAGLMAIAAHGAERVLLRLAGAFSS